MNNAGSSALDATRDLFPLVSEAAAQPGPVAREVIDRMDAAGLFGVMVPEACGGLELPVSDALDVFAEAARADGSAGWCLMAGAATIAFFGAWAEDETIDRLFADGVPRAAGQFAPNGVAVPVDGGYRLTGDYSFGSGIAHAEWVGAGVMTQPDDGADPAYLFAIMPADQVELKGNWDVMGLAATASWDYSLDGVEVPASATFDFFAPVRRRGGPVYDLGILVLTALGHAGFAIGVTRRALDELADLAATKTRMGAGSSLAESEPFQLALARLDRGPQRRRRGLGRRLPRPSGERWPARSTPLRAPGPGRPPSTSRGRAPTSSARRTSWPGRRPCATVRCSVASATCTQRRSISSPATSRRSTWPRICWRRRHTRLLEGAPSANSSSRCHWCSSWLM